MMRGIVDGKVNTSKVNSMFDDVKTAQQEASSKLCSKVWDVESKQEVLKTRMSTEISKYLKMLKQDRSVIVKVQSTLTSCHQSSAFSDLCT